jgi:toxin ParE1/3/4
MLLEYCNEVACNPELGKNYSGIIENMLGVKAGRHIIFYRKLEENEEEITRILHEQMDLKNRITEKYPHITTACINVGARNASHDR